MTTRLIFMLVSSLGEGNGVYSASSNLKGRVTLHQKNYFSTKVRKFIISPNDGNLQCQWRILDICRLPTTHPLLHLVMPVVVSATHRTALVDHPSHYV